MQLDAIPPQTPQPQPKDRPGPHSPQPDPIPSRFPTHELAPLRWEMSEIFPGMVCRKPTVRIRSNAGYGYVRNHRPVVA